MKISPFYESMGILAATTIGAGMFALPWVLSKVGWNVFLFLLFGLGSVVAFGEILYWQVLQKIGERLRLVRLANRYLGRFWNFMAFFSILGGMLFALIVYLILGTQFLDLILPFPPTINLILFWMTAAFPALFSLRRFAILELTGTLAMAAMIILIFMSAPGDISYGSTNATLPLIITSFGILLFSLTGWNAIEPMHEVSKGKLEPVRLIGGSVLLVIASYLLFSMGIFSWSGGSVSADAISGANFPFLVRALIAILGLIAIWTSYVPSALEIQSVLKKDFAFRETTALTMVLFSPLFFVMLGFGDLLRTISFAGAVFTGLQFIIIFLVAQKVLRLRDGKAFAAQLSIFIFLSAAAFEVYQFFIR